jgi:hypothetical protein
MSDLELLRRHEPIVRFTYGELFFPMQVGPYVRECSLWLRDRRNQLIELEKSGQITLERLAEYDKIEPGQTMFLRFVEDPLEGVAYQRWKFREDRPRFQAPGRLARVGLASRLLDSIFSLSLILRGTVPGGTAGAAAIAYNRIMTENPHHTYYGRVVREGGYIILQYFFFYAMNDWRSTFYGVNDHEADWEQIIIYLSEQPGCDPVPEWIAFASHDYQGDDLRRRWDDPTITVEDGHPVVFAGAGSHASYFERGEYLHSVKLAFLHPLFTVLHAGERIWRNVLRQGDPEKLVDRIEGFLSVPFVDYARGDGLSVGPGQAQDWIPEIICDTTGWAQEFRGLWGYDARDPLAGETAPGGPKFNRDGSTRRSWHDPLGWAGMHKVAPGPVATGMLLTHLQELESNLMAVEERSDVLTSSLPRLELEVRALKLSKHNQSLVRTQEESLRNGEAELNGLFNQRAELQERINASRIYLQQIRETGNFGDPQSHIQHIHRPQSEDVVQKGRLAEGWAALSTGIVLLVFIALVISGVASWVAVLALVSGMFLLVEAILYRKLERLLLNVTVMLAVVTTGVLVYEFFWEILVIGSVALAGLIITDNIRELRG